MDEEDEKEFLNHVVNDFDSMVIVGQRHKNSEPKELKDFSELADLKDINYRMFYLLNKDISDSINLDFFSKPNDYVVNMFNSLFIEYHRYSINKDKLESGRLYIAPEYLRDSNLNNDKIEKLIKWYEHLARWIKNRYKKVPKDGRYVGPHAFDRYRKGEIKLLLNSFDVYTDKDVKLDKKFFINEKF